jgi:hypothetical protein
MLHYENSFEMHRSDAKINIILSVLSFILLPAYFYIVSFI